MAIHRTNVNVDDESFLMMKELPRKVSASAILRVMLRACVMSSTDFERYKSKSDEARAVRDYLREKSRLMNIRSLVM